MANSDKLLGDVARTGTALYYLYERAATQCSGWLQRALHRRADGKGAEAALRERSSASIPALQRRRGGRAGSQGRDRGEMELPTAVQRVTGRDLVKAARGTIALRYVS